MFVCLFLGRLSALYRYFIRAHVFFFLGFYVVFIFTDPSRPPSRLSRPLSNGTGAGQDVGGFHDAADGPRPRRRRRRESLAQEGCGGVGGGDGRLRVRSRALHGGGGHERAVLSIRRVRADAALAVALKMTDVVFSFRSSAVQFSRFFSGLIGERLARESELANTK